MDYSKASDCGGHESLRVIWEEEMGLPLHLIVLMHNLNCGQEGTVNMEKPNAFLKANMSDKGILSFCLFNLYAEYVK